MADRGTPGQGMPRRTFVGWVGKGSAAVAAGGFLRFFGRNDAFNRPPRARPEEEFLSLCIKCDKCMQACPYGSITMVALTESVISAGTPVLREPCRVCMACVHVCPTGALDAKGYRL